MDRAENEVGFRDIRLSWVGSDGECCGCLRSAVGKSCI